MVLVCNEVWLMYWYYAWLACLLSSSIQETQLTFEGAYILRIIKRSQNIDIYISLWWAYGIRTLTCYMSTTLDGRLIFLVDRGHSSWVIIEVTRMHAVRNVETQESSAPVYNNRRRKTRRWLCLNLNNLPFFKKSRKEGMQTRILVSQWMCILKVT